MVALSPKCYMAYDPCRAECKKGCKGIPYNTELDLEMYRQRLYDDDAEFKFPVISLQRKRQKMSRVAIEKNGLNHIFLKLQLAPDGITCSPLCDEYGEYL